jgi:hypothetical protein
MGYIAIFSLVLKIYPGGDLNPGFCVLFRLNSRKSLCHDFGLIEEKE